MSIPVISMEDLHFEIHPKRFVRQYFCFLPELSPMRVKLPYGVLLEIQAEIYGSLHNLGLAATFENAGDV